MGAGIAQVAAVAGHPVLVTDAVPGAAERAIARLRDRVKSWGGRAGRGEYPDVDADALDLAAVDLPGLAACDVVIEAIVEDLAVKRELLAALEKIVRPGCVLASNSSSLSPTAMAAGLEHPGRLVGLHFFNPAPVMKLVEVISGLATSPEIAERAADLAVAWGKTVVRSAATPGFIVNRIARPFYAEAWRVWEEGGSVPENIDAVLTGAAGFRIGPFALMDLIGHDVNEAVTRSVWAAFGHDPRFVPSLAQRALVEAGWLGRKSGRGIYSYADAAAPLATPAAPAAVTPAATPAAATSAAASPAAAARAPDRVMEYGASPLRPLLDRCGVAIVTADRADPAAGLPGGLVELPSGALLAQCEGVTATALAATAGRPVIVVDRVLDPGGATAIAIAPSDGCPVGSLAAAAGLFQAANLDVFVIDDVPGLIVTRTVAMLANLAADALASRVANAADIDTAMRLGVSYPLGPLAWADQWGVRTVLTILDNLENWYRDGRYRASPLLRRTALSGQALSAR
jgi:3-hydroxybutyryl-CoA dehydrogenase